MMLSAGMVKHSTIVPLCLGLMKLLCQHSAAACDHGFYKHGNIECCRCQKGWFVKVNCSQTDDKNIGRQCLPCTDCGISGQKNASACTDFSDTVCMPEPTPAPSADVPEWVVISLYVSACLILLLIITAVVYKLYLTRKAPVDPAKCPLKTPSITESLA